MLYKYINSLLKFNLFLSIYDYKIILLKVL